MNDQAKSSWDARLTWGAVLFCLAGFAGVCLWQSERDARSVRDMPEADRKVLYERTMETLSTVCSGEHAGPVVSLCREQAALIMSFPECDDRCREVARAHWPRPTR